MDGSIYVCVVCGLNTRIKHNIVMAGHLRHEMHYSIMCTPLYINAVCSYMCECDAYSMYPPLSASAC